MKIGDTVQYRGKKHYIVTGKDGKLKLKPVSEFQRLY